MYNTSNSDVVKRKTGDQEQLPTAQMWASKPSYLFSSILISTKYICILFIKSISALHSKYSDKRVYFELGISIGDVIKCLYVYMFYGFYKYLSKT